jgi:hypothetical protein
MLTDEVVEEYIRELDNLDLIEAFVRLYELIDPETKKLEVLRAADYKISKAHALRLSNELSSRYGHDALLLWLDKGPSCSHE